MFKFKILKRSKKSRARLGLISTPHGEIETPAFVPVATRATVRTLESDEVSEAGAQVLICNTYHLYTAPGAKNVKRAGGLHEFMRWKKPLMTDSGGFQVFSLGFGQYHDNGGRCVFPLAHRRYGAFSRPQAIHPHSGSPRRGYHVRLRRMPFTACQREIHAPLARAHTSLGAHVSGSKELEARSRPLRHRARRQFQVAAHRERQDYRRDANPRIWQRRGIRQQQTLAQKDARRRA